jgi:acetamidase/formamidase
MDPAHGVLHGSFDRSLTPALTVASGDSIRFSTLDGDWLTGPDHSAERRPHDVSPLRRPIVDDGHALCGPVAIEGAEPGSVLEVRIEEVVTGAWGWSRVGGRDVDHDLRLGVCDGDQLYLHWQLDHHQGIATSDLGHEVRMRPFMGVRGMPADIPGPQSTHPPRRTGGNIDCKELIAGTSLFLPVEVAGGLFSIGDGHAAQGDGEVGSTAIECPMDVARVTLLLRDDLEIDMPVARTASEWLTFGFSEDMKTAVYQALNGMVGLVRQLFGVGRKEALAMCSPVVDVRMTQIVNGVCGAHAALPHGAVTVVRSGAPRHMTR